MRIGTLVLAAALVAGAFSARSGESGPPLPPDSVLAHISIESPERLLEALDGFTAALTVATRGQIEPGMLLFMAQMYNPLSEELWDRERPLHLVIGARRPNRDALLRIPTRLAFPDFLAGLTELGAVAEPLEGREDAVHLTMRGLSPLIVSDIGDGYAQLAVGMEMDALAREFAASWQPRHWGGGLVNAVVNLPEDWVERSGILDEIEETVARFESGGLPDATAADADLEAMRASMRMLSLWLPGLRRELSALTGLALEVELDAERLTARVQARAAPESLVAALAANAPAAGGVDLGLARAAESDAGALFAFADFGRLIPDLPARLDEFYGALATAMGATDTAPLRGAQARLLGSLKGGGAFALTADAEQFGYRFWCRSDDAAGFIAAYGDLLEAMNALTAAAADNPLEYRVSDHTAADGLAYKKIEVHFDVDAWLAALPNADDSEALRDMMREMVNTVVLIAPAGGDVVAGVSGAVGEAELRQAIAAAGGAASPWLAAPAVDEALRHLPDQDIALFLADMDRMFTLTFGLTMKGMAAAHDPAATGTIARAWEAIQPQLRSSDDPTALSLGSRTGGLAADFTVTAAALNAVQYNVGLFQDTLQALLYSENAEDGDDDWTDDEEAEDEEFYRDQDDAGEDGAEDVEQIDAA